MELWAPVYALDPETIECMDQQAYGFHYCGARQNDRGAWEFNHSSNENELRERLRARFMHVVTEDQLAHTEGAKRLRSIVFMDHDVRSAEHKEWDRKNLSSLKISDLDDKADQGDLARLRKELGIRKMPWVERYVRERLSTGESILLFVWHREVALGLRSALKEFKPGLIIGGVKADEREKTIRDFQAGKSRLIVANISAAGRGHNLQKADRIVFGEFSWTDELNKQCEHRAARRGRVGHVRAVYIACPNSIDEPILNSNFTKEKRVKRVIG
jgi:SNF2 family DNA or RNA helicase